jgi:hypothetical protein
LTPVTPLGLAPQLIDEFGCDILPTQNLSLRAERGPRFDAYYQEGFGKINIDR